MHGVLPCAAAARVRNGNKVADSLSNLNDKANCSTGNACHREALSVLHCRSQPSGFFKIAVSGNKTDIRVKGKQSLALLSRPPGQGHVPESPTGSPVAATASRPTAFAGTTGQASSSNSSRPSSYTQLRPVPLTPKQTAFPAVEPAGAASDMGSYEPATPLIVPVQRLYEFSAEVWPAPPDGPFRASKVVSIKSKYILSNDTGMVLEYKQKGTPDHGHPGYVSYGEGRRFAGLLQAHERYIHETCAYFRPCCTLRC
eukprot:GHRR01025064.1.p1 GENE.GHRR01025064.1~~GHRR01025064.1.p1  ORF type:complete len:256 (-),score=81.16 GHRR01025064.1:211-978(-)